MPQLYNAQKIVIEFQEHISELVEVTENGMDTMMEYV